MCAATSSACSTSPTCSAWARSSSDDRRASWSRARDRNAGLLVDRIIGTINYDSRRIEPPPSTTGPGDSYLGGIVQIEASPIPLLDVEKILYTDAMA
ncbi:MAG: chemotaxis protein CheW [Planctomycetes bacterium]|nr:chemotaxis protein CheW [Planctomycetota bacterium]